jgi:hypothetical protein
MFKHLSNATCGTPCVLVDMLGGMHASAERLYMAANELRGVAGQSNVARLLNESPQTVKNWEKRGVSGAGAIKAEGVIGCRSRIAASARHAPTRDAKTLVLEWWRANGDKGRLTKEAAADQIIALRLVSESRTTVRRWLAGK